MHLLGVFYRRYALLDCRFAYSWLVLYLMWIVVRAFRVVHRHIIPFPSQAQ